MPERKGAHDRLLWALHERAKELACLYEVEEILKRTEASLVEVFQAVILAIPPGWQYPEICQARITFGDQTQATEDYLGTPWEQSAPIVVEERVVGQLTVSYREARTSADEGPFLREEGKLIRTIADRLGHFILHQRLRDLFQEWHQAQEAWTTAGPAEWRFALNLLGRTDPDLFVRISWKMANHLAWQGLPEAQGLVQGFGQDRQREEAAVVGEKNQPSLKQPLEALGDQVFTLAARTLPDEEILACIQRWIHEDRASFLVRTVVSAQSSPADIADAIRRYQHVAREGAGLGPSTLTAVGVNLIRRFLSDDLGYLKVAKEYVSLDDMLGLLEHIIGLPGSQGRIGGKGAGLFLASRILARHGGQDVDSMRVPRTWFIASDASLGFIRYNNLEEVYEQKYKDLDQVRLEYPHLVRVFQNAPFPPELVRGLSLALDDFGDTPLIVRSSSLLEDRLGAVFSGKYKSLFLANQGSKPERLAAMLDAIAEVYASIFSPDPIQYRAERGLLDFREEMGILIEEVVGRRVGPYYLPAFAGVAVSRNEFRWSPRIRREDGLVRLVPGLGTRAVDRVGEDYPVLISPGQPGLRVNVTPEEAARYAPRFADVLDLERRTLTTVSIRALVRAHGSDYPGLHHLLSVIDHQGLHRLPALLMDFERDEHVVTFEGLLQDTPFVNRVGTVLRTLGDVLGYPVEVEFASDGSEVFLLQCRPQAPSQGTVPMPIPRDVPPDRVVFSALRHVSNGQVPDITHIVYVDPEAYAALEAREDLLAVGRLIGRLNALLPKRQFILMGPGRWGSRGDPKLGVPVTYSDLSHTAALLEIARPREEGAPDLSFGTHFFQDLVEASIRYLPLYPDDPGVVFNAAMFREAPNALPELLPPQARLAPVVKVLDVPAFTDGLVLKIHADAEMGMALGFLAEPSAFQASPRRPSAPEEAPNADHARWRLRMAERLAAQLDGARFHVRALYLVGSAKNATAGPQSGIDLLVHLAGQQPEEALIQWLEGWSLCLDEMNHLRTGFRRGGLLQVHFLTDEDLARRENLAGKIGAATDAARPLPLLRGGDSGV